MKMKAFGNYRYLKSPAVEQELRTRPMSELSYFGSVIWNPLSCLTAAGWLTLRRLFPDILSRNKQRKSSRNRLTEIHPEKTEKKESL